MSTNTSTAAPTSSASQTATDLVGSVIRTVVPYIAGLILSWIAMLHLPFTIGPAAEPKLEAALTFVFGTLWYLVVRFLETKWPALGWLLGIAKQPTYTAPTMTLVQKDGTWQLDADDEELIGLDLSKITAADLTGMPSQVTVASASAPTPSPATTLPVTADVAVAPTVTVPPPVDPTTVAATDASSASPVAVVPPAQMSAQPPAQP